jgi:hypothetical protein
MKDARDQWIAQNDAQDWMDAHGFFQGACCAVKQYLQIHGNDRLYVITTKAKDFTTRLLQMEGLYDQSGTDALIKESHIYGLGSGPKDQVLQKILEERNGDVGVMVEDNIATLQKIMASPIKEKVLPVVAAWGYNTTQQLLVAKEEGYVILSETDSSSLGILMNDDRVSVEWSKMIANRR